MSGQRGRVVSLQPRARGTRRHISPTVQKEAALGCSSTLTTALHAEANSSKRRTETGPKALRKAKVYNSPEPPIPLPKAIRHHRHHSSVVNPRWPFRVFASPLPSLLLSQAQSFLQVARPWAKPEHRVHAGWDTHGHLVASTPSRVPAQPTLKPLPRTMQRTDEAGG